MLERPPRQGHNIGRRICSVIAASLGNARHAVLTIFITAIGIAVGNADGGAEGIIY